VTDSTFIPARSVLLFLNYNFINSPIDPSLVTDITGYGICPNTIYNRAI